MSSAALPARDLAWVRAISEPDCVLAWTLPNWEHTIRLSRRLRLLGRLAEGVNSAGLMGAVPPVVARHLIAELRFSRWRTGTLLWAIDRIGVHLGEVHFPLVLLKGAAYVAQGLPIARGRLPSDIDILVPKSNIAEAQARLSEAGWVEIELDAHDRRYYHEWSHEVPPMQHTQFGLELDLHHNILPPVGRLKIDADLLLARLQPSSLCGWHVLSPADQVLHSAAHVFHDSEVRDRLRDLVDLDGLFRHFSRTPLFWSVLEERARELGLGECLALACHFTATWLETPIPAEVADRLTNLGPSGLRKASLRYVFGEALTPLGPDSDWSLSQSTAAKALLARHHLSRMPMRLLVPHLWHKLVVGYKRAAAAGARAERP